MCSTSRCWFPPAFPQASVREFLPCSPPAPTKPSKRRSRRFACRSAQSSPMQKPPQFTSGSIRSTAMFTLPSAAATPMLYRWAAFFRSSEKSQPKCRKPCREPQDQFPFAFSDSSPLLLPLLLGLCPLASVPWPLCPHGCCSIVTLTALVLPLAASPFSIVGVPA